MKNKLKTFDSWVNEEYLQSSNAEDYAISKGLDLKKVGDESELVNGGAINKELIDVVSELEKSTGLQFTVTAGNDAFHKNYPNSHHNRGNAIDIVFKESSDNTIDNRKRVESALISLINSGKYNKDGYVLGGINEYDKPSRHATGGHFHISLAPKNRENNFAFGDADVPTQTEDHTLKNKFYSEEFKFFSRHFVKVLTAKYDASTNSFILYKRNGDEFAKVNYRENKVIVTKDGQSVDISSTKDGEIFKEIFETKSKEAKDVPPSMVKVVNGSYLVKQGMSGDEVTEIQKRLIELGYLGGTPNGVYDQATVNAVLVFQRDSNILVDGIVGPVTSSKLYGVENNQQYMSQSTSSGAGAISKNTTDFNTVVETVIARLEGGYYHPDMLEDGRVKDSRYGASGETMMGIDRLAGGKLNDTPAGKEFWSIIDNANARSTWAWNYRGGSLEPQLRRLAGEIIKPQFEKLASKYLTPEARGLVYSDGRLLFHFIYATWNGSGWFQKFATDVNQAVAAGVKDTDSLLRVAMDSRTKEGLKPGSAPNSLVAQGGKKIERILGLA